MVVEYDPGADSEIFVRLAELQRLDDNIAVRCFGEDRQPGNGSCRDEVCSMQFMNAITAPHDVSIGEAQRREQARSQVQLGNEERSLFADPTEEEENEGIVREGRVIA